MQWRCVTAKLLRHNPEKKTNISLVFGSKCFLQLWTQSVAGGEVLVFLSNWNLYQCSIRTQKVLQRSISIWKAADPIIPIDYILQLRTAVKWIYSFSIKYLTSPRYTLWPERSGRGGPCWLLKLRWRGLSRCLVSWARQADTGGFYPALAALVSTVQNVFFLAVHCFNLCAPIDQQPGQ